MQIVSYDIVLTFFSFHFRLQQVAQQVVQRMATFLFFSDRPRSSKSVLPARLSLNTKSFSYGSYVTHLIIPFCIAASKEVFAAPKTYLCRSELRARISTGLNNMLLLRRAENQVFSYVVPCT